MFGNFSDAKLVSYIDVEWNDTTLSFIGAPAWKPAEYLVSVGYETNSWTNLLRIDELLQDTLTEYHKDPYGTHFRATLN